MHFISQVPDSHCGKMYQTRSGVRTLHGEAAVRFPVGLKS